MLVNPNSRNVVPGEVRFSVDLRHADDAGLERMEQEMQAASDRLAREAQCEATVDRVASYAACRFDESCVVQVRKGAQDAGLPHMDIVSGAGHDAVYMARICPTGMIFVPCEGGISHNEIENARPEHLAAGCDVLLRAMMERAGVAHR